MDAWIFWRHLHKIFRKNRNNYNAQEQIQISFEWQLPSITWSHWKLHNTRMTRTAYSLSRGYYSIFTRSVKVKETVSKPQKLSVIFLLHLQMSKQTNGNYDDRSCRHQRTWKCKLNILPGKRMDIKVIYRLDAAWKRLWDDSIKGN